MAQGGAVRPASNSTRSGRNTDGRRVLICETDSLSSTRRWSSSSRSRSALRSPAVGRRGRPRELRHVRSDRRDRTLRSGTGCQVRGVRRDADSGSNRRRAPRRGLGPEVASDQVTFRSRPRRTALRQELGREPDASELAHALGLTRRDVDRVQAQVRSGNVLSLEQPVGPDNDGSRTLRDRVVDHASDPDTSDRWEEVKELVAAATEGIDRRARDILRMSYVERRTLADIGRALGVTESRVCQIRTRALRAARERVQLQMRVGDVGLPAASSVAVQV